MNKARSISRNIQSVASKTGVSLESLKGKIGIHEYRLEGIWSGSVVPEYKELATLAKALQVDEAVLSNGNAERLWTRLKAIAQEWRFQKLWPEFALQTGLRGPDSPDSDDALIDEMILEDQKERLWDPDDPPPYWKKY